jgi:hypothetical protein
MNPRAALLILACLFAGETALAQSNADPAIDLLLADITDLAALGRQGTFPNGVNGCALETTACNLGTKPISWQAAMDPDHPFIAFILARETNGRFQQISDRSYVKHGFFALSGSVCNTCSPTDGTTLGLGCSDTYAKTNNGDNYWLGPPDEIDPWHGLWNPVCSHFDQGEPPVAPPANCNGGRSLTQAQAQALGPVAHRVRVRDAEFNVPGSTFWFEGMYVIETEGDAARENNLGSRKFTPVWTGTSWNLIESDTLLHGTILQRWSGASVSSNTNGADDGRLCRRQGPAVRSTASTTTSNAIHNATPPAAWRAARPICPQARCELASTTSDQDATNEWSAGVAGSEIVFSGGSNPLLWNRSSTSGSTQTLRRSRARSGRRVRARPSASPGVGRGQAPARALQRLPRRGLRDRDAADPARRRHAAAGPARQLDLRPAHRGQRTLAAQLPLLLARGRDARDRALHELPRNLRERRVLLGRRADRRERRRRARDPDPEQDRARGAGRVLPGRGPAPRRAPLLEVRALRRAPRPHRELRRRLPLRARARCRAAASSSDPRDRCGRAILARLGARFSDSESSERRYSASPPSSFQRRAWTTSLKSSVQTRTSGRASAGQGGTTHLEAPSVSRLRATTTQSAA